MSKRKPNAYLLKRIYYYIVEHPESWLQKTYAANKSYWLFPEKNVCGTAFCVAGHALVLTGHKPIFTQDLPELGLTNAEADVWAAEVTGRFLNNRNGKLVDAEKRAAKVLGLTAVQASSLFDADNDIETIKELIEEIIGENLDD